LAFAAGWGITYVRLWYAWKCALCFKVVQPGVKPRSLHHFWDDYAVEVAARIGRVFDEDGISDPVALDIAENVLKVWARLQMLSYLRARSLA